MADTALTLITEALREIRVLASDETAQDGLATRVFHKLNDMLDSWSIENIMCYVQQEESHALTIGTSTYTIGSGGTIATTRPKSINQAWIRDSNNVDYPLDVWGSQRWGQIPRKGISGWPDVLYYYANYPLGTIKLDQAPQQAFTLYFVSDKPFTRFSALTTELAFPPGYKRALVANLAVDRAPSFGKKPSDELKEIAIASKEVIRRLNLPEIVSGYDCELTAHRGGFDINTGGYA